MSLLLVGSMLTSNVMTYAAETDRIQTVTTAESVEAEPVEDVRKVTPSDAKKIEDSITDGSPVKTPDDYGDIMTPEQFQKVNESLLEMKLLQAEIVLQDAENAFSLAEVNLYKKENGTGSDWKKTIRFPWTIVSGSSMNSIKGQILFM